MSSKLTQLIDWLFFRGKDYELWILIATQLCLSIPLFFKKNLKFDDKITLDNILFVNKSINRQVAPIFHDLFTFSINLCRYETCRFINDHFNIPTFWTQYYGGFSIKVRVYIHGTLYKIYLKNYHWKTQKIKYFCTKHFIKNY